MMPGWRTSLNSRKTVPQECVVTAGAYLCLLDWQDSRWWLAARRSQGKLLDHGVEQTASQSDRGTLQSSRQSFMGDLRV